MIFKAFSSCVKRRWMRLCNLKTSCSVFSRDCLTEVTLNDSAVFEMWDAKKEPVIYAALLKDVLLASSPLLR